MDARGVEREPRPFLVRESAAKSRGPIELPGSEEPAVGVAETAIPWSSAASHGKDAMARISPDPMRATDRYRLVMPWSARV